VAKEIMTIMFGNKTGRLIDKFLESPFAGKHPKLITKSTKEAAAEAAVSPTQAGRGTCPGEGSEFTSKDAALQEGSAKLLLG
jgi:hypothetical protein